MVYKNRESSNKSVSLKDKCIIHKPEAFQNFCKIYKKRGWVEGRVHQFIVQNMPSKIPEGK